MDYTPVQRLGAFLEQKKIADVREYLLAHPGLVKKTFRQVKIMDANKAAYNLYAVKTIPALFAGLQKTLTTTASDFLIEQFIALLCGEPDFCGEFQCRTWDKKTRDVFMRIVAVGPVGRPFARILVTLQDITTWKKMERLLRRRAQMDSLTGLLNHSAIMQSLEEELIRAKRYGLTLSCMMVDLDFFKVVNDKFGHQRGDQILKRVSKMIKNCFRRMDIIGRYGGDEFLVILPNTKPRLTKYAAQRLQRVFANTVFNYKKAISFYITLSIGIAGYPSKKVKDAKDLVALADKAMYACKMAGRNRIEVV